MSNLTLGRETLGRAGRAAEHEWLVTNGIGGFASSTVSLMNTRRYHGLLFAALRPPVDRIAMVSKLELTARYGDEHIALSTNEFADGTLAPLGVVHLESFRLEGLVPVWTWLLGDARLEQRIWMSHGENTTYVRFTRVGGVRRLELVLEPLCTYRDYHWQLRGSRSFSVEAAPQGLRVTAEEGARPYAIIAETGRIDIRPQWHWNFRHREESARGLDDLEDLFRPALIEIDLPPGVSRSVILTAEAHEPMPAEIAFGSERSRQGELRSCFREANAGGCASHAPEIEQLALAADQFVVERRDPLGAHLGHSIIAGYPWFSDWGRDTMIALPGLTLITGRSAIAASVLRTFARFVDQGLLPNRFPDAGEAPEYNTADASLWYFVAVHNYLKSTADARFAAEIYPILQHMLLWHRRGTRFGIAMDETDGLLRAGESGVQITWMDAKVGDWVVTPRIGKPVEINALWFNAVCILRDLAVHLGRSDDAREYATLAENIATSFEQQFWFEAGGYLYDVIDGPEGDPDETGRRRDSSLRPNQIFALSLPFALLRGEKAARMLEVCSAELWTPVGLRSLAARDARYRGRYGGGPTERDGAYHQGTVWTWLLGPFAIAHYRVHANPKAAQELLHGMLAHLREGCIGQISEIMDADAPFEPRGCIAQAWGVAEFMRAWREINTATPVQHPHSLGQACSSTLRTESATS